MSASAWGVGSGVGREKSSSHAREFSEATRKFKQARSKSKEEGREAINFKFARRKGESARAGGARDPSLPLPDANTAVMHNINFCSHCQSNNISGEGEKLVVNIFGTSVAVRRWHVKPSPRERRLQKPQRLRRSP